MLLLTASLAFSLLRSAVDAPKHLTYSGEVQVLRFGENKSEAAIYRIEHRSPNLTRRWYLAPAGLYGDSIVSRGGRRGSSRSNSKRPNPHGSRLRK